MNNARFEAWSAQLSTLTPLQRQKTLQWIVSINSPLVAQERLSDKDDSNQELDSKPPMATSYKAVMQTMAEESEYVRKIIDLSTDMVVAVNVNRIVIVFNKAAEKTYGYQVSEVVGKPVNQLYGSDVEAQTIGEHMRRKGSFFGEATGRRKNGEIFPVHLVAALLHNAEGKNIGSVGYSRDLTPEKAAKEIERQYTAMRELEELKRDVDRMSRHDLKSPLNSVIGFSDLMINDSTLSEDHKEMVRIINKSGHTLVRMINLSLDLFKMERGTYELESKKVDIIPILKDIRLDHNDEISYRELSFDFLVDDQPITDLTKFEVMGEATLCYNMLANLLKNAIEASPEGSKTVTVRMENRDKSVIKIHNFGSVPEEIRETFFEKYATHGKRHGTGLGTHSALLMVQSQQGEIEMQTDDILGTTIIVQLPRPVG